MTELSLPKKLTKHVVRGEIVFSRDTFGIERIIGDKMISLNFVGAW
jgi:hypothetical protein